MIHQPCEELFVTSTVDLPTQRDVEQIDIRPAPAEATVTLPEQTDEVAETIRVDEPAKTGTTGDMSEVDTSESEPQAQRAQWEAECNRVIEFDPNIVVIDVNVRTENAETDDATVNSMRVWGVDMAVKGYRAEDGTVLIIRGQRRVLNARKAGCPVPVWMVPPPSADNRKAEIERIVTQLNENDLRTGLTLGDKYRAVQQLAAFNLTPTGIARKLARGTGGTKYVENVVKAGGSELACKAAERYDLDVVQTAVVGEFDSYGDLDTPKELIRLAVAEPNNFAVYAERKRAVRAEDERVRELTDQLAQKLTEAGAAILTPEVSEASGDARPLDRLRPSPADEPYTPLTAEDHAACPGHAAWIEQDYDDKENRIVVAVYGCSAFRAHGHALSDAPAGRADVTPDLTVVPTGSTEVAREAAAAAAIESAAAEDRARRAAAILRKWVIENNKLWDASVKVRRTWLAGFVKRAKAPTGAQVFLALRKAKGGHELRRAMERNHQLAHTLLDLPQPGLGTISQLPDKISVAPAAKATLYDVFLTLCAMEEDLARDSFAAPVGRREGLHVHAHRLGLPRLRHRAQGPQPRARGRRHRRQGACVTACVPL